MEALYLILPLSIVLALVIVGAIVWASRSGQFDDLDSPPLRVLLDDDRPGGPEEAPEMDAGAEGARGGGDETSGPASRERQEAVGARAPAGSEGTGEGPEKGAP